MPQLLPIESAPNDHYRAGSDGHIYCRTKYLGFGRKAVVAWYRLDGHVTAKGYINISMSHDGMKVTRAVHRLVCLAFHGSPPSGKTVVRHLDGDLTNNVPTNLAWASAAEIWQVKLKRDAGQML